jgi:hypothetical protein
MSIKIYDKAKIFGKTKVVVNSNEEIPTSNYNLYFGDNQYPIIISAGEGSANPNGTFIILETTNIPNGTEIPYTITGVSQEDIDIPLTGTLTVDRDFSYVAFNIIEDNLTEGPETMVVTLDGITPTVSAALIINDTSTE